MKRTTISVTRFQLEQGFWSNVYEETGEVFFWLGHKDSDIQELMYAAPKAILPPERWEETLMQDIQDYMADFREAWLEK